MTNKAKMSFKNCSYMDTIESGNMKKITELFVGNTVGDDRVNLLVDHHFKTVKSKDVKARVTPLGIALKLQDKPVYTWLMQNGSDLSLVIWQSLNDGSPKSSLHAMTLAVSVEADASTIEMLLQYGASYKEKDVYMGLEVDSLSLARKKEAEGSANAGKIVRVLEKFEGMSSNAALACSRQRKTSTQRDAFASAPESEREKEKEKEKALRKANSTSLPSKGPLKRDTKEGKEASEPKESSEETLARAKTESSLPQSPRALKRAFSDVKRGPLPSSPPTSPRVRTNTEVVAPSEAASPVSPRRKNTSPLLSYNPHEGKALTTAKKDLPGQTQPAFVPSLSLKNDAGPSASPSYHAPLSPVRRNAVNAQTTAPSSPPVSPRRTNTSTPNPVLARQASNELATTYTPTSPRKNTAPNAMLARQLSEGGAPKPSDKPNPLRSASERLPSTTGSHASTPEGSRPNSHGAHAVSFQKELPKGEKPKEKEKDKERDPPSGGRLSPRKVYQKSLRDFQLIEESKLFGMKYENLIDQLNPLGLILPFLDQALAYLQGTPEALCMEGLFRVSANKNELDALKDRIDRCEPVDWVGMADPHLVAGIIKLFLRTMPEPLLTFQLYPSFIEVAEQKSPSVAFLLKNLVDKLPPPNRILFRRLVSLFGSIVKYEEANLMTIQNLAVVFGPTLLYTKHSGAANNASMYKEIQSVNMVVVLVYTHAEVIFPKEGVSHEAKPLPAKTSLPPTPKQMPTPKERDTISPPQSPRHPPPSPFDKQATGPANANAPSNAPSNAATPAKHLPAIPSKLAHSAPSKASQSIAPSESVSLSSSGSVASRPESPRVRLESERDLLGELDAQKSPRNPALNAQVYARLLECKETLDRIEAIKAELEDLRSKEESEERRSRLYLSEKIICLEIRKGTDKVKVLRLVAPLFKRDPELGLQLMERAREAASPLTRKELSAQIAIIMKHDNPISFYPKLVLAEQFLARAHEAVVAGSAEDFQQAFLGDFDPRFLDLCHNKHTLLCWCVLYNRIEMAKLVLDKGASLNATNMLGRTPVELATTAVGKDESYKEIKEFLTSKST